MKQSPASIALLDRIDAAAMLHEVETWSAINTGTANLDGLAQQARVLADAFADLPGAVEMVDPAPVTAIAEVGHDFATPHGPHSVLRVRPQATRRQLPTRHKTPEKRRVGKGCGSTYQSV